MESARSSQDVRNNAMPMMSWSRFAVTIAVSIAVMFPLMYQLVYAFDHVLFSVSRLVASFVMGAVMTLVMLASMWSMFRGTATKIIVLAGALLAAVALLAINRSQVLIDDTTFMEAMIPHHSIAVNNARKADIRDPRVRYLADRIIRDQIKEIAEMEMLIADIERNGRLADEPLAPGPAELKPQGRKEAQDLVDAKLPGSENATLPPL